MSILTECTICGVLEPCDLIDGLCLCDSCYDDYKAHSKEFDAEYCAGECADCDDWEGCGG